MKYKNKYRIPSARLPRWDYRTPAPYFVTICTKNNKHLFGRIKNGKMILSHTGKLANKFWRELPNHFSHIKLGAFVVMPNHMHGIVIIGNNGMAPVQTLHEYQDVQTLHARSLHPMAAKSPKSGSLSTIIRSYKSAVSKNAHLTHSNFAWLPRFHDHVIRNNDEYQRITNYIINNPGKWAADKFHSG